jgi:hypothetical protein
MDYETLFPGRFLKGVDLKGPVTAVIKDTVGEEIDGKLKAVISFEGAKKQFVCNRTNAEAIRLMFGRDTTAWVGHRITLAAIEMPDPFSGGTATITPLRVIGSPEIDKPMSAEVKRGRKTLKIAVKPTGTKPAAKNGNGKPAGAAQTAPKASEPSEEEKQQILEQERRQADSEQEPSF